METELNRAAHNCAGTYTSSTIWLAMQAAANNLQAGFNTLAGFMFARRLYVDSEKMKIYSAQAAGELMRIAQLYALPMDF